MIPLPYADENSSFSLRVVLIPLIAANVLVFFIELQASSLAEVFKAWGFLPSHPDFYRWFTAQFIHADFWHLAGNMWFLWIFGDNVEGRLKNGFLPFYLIGGAAANGFDMLMRHGSDVPAVGASGAISAVLGAYFVFFPNAMVRCWWFLGYYSQTVSLSALAFGGLYVGSQILMMFLDRTGGVAYAAHLGGAVFGGLVALALRQVPEAALDSSGPAGQTPRNAGGPRRDFGSLAVEAPKDGADDYAERVRRDPYFVLPEAQQLQAAERLAGSGRPQLAWSAAEKFLLRYPSSPTVSRARLLLGRLEQDWFRDFAAARKRLERALEGTLSPEERTEALSRLEKVRAALGKTFLEPAQDGEKYWLVRESAETLEADARALLSKSLLEPAAALDARLAKDPGILARDLGRVRAAALADALEARRVPVIVLPQRSVLLPPPTESLLGLSPEADGLALKPENGAGLKLPWDGVLLIAAAGLRGKGGVEYVLDVNGLDPLRRFRWRTQDEGLFFGDLQDLLVGADRVPVDSGALSAFERALPESCLFTSSEALENYMAWQLQLAYQKKEGIYKP